MTVNGNSSDPALRSLEALLPDLADLYKDVHSHPELSSSLRSFLFWRKRF